MNALPDARDPLTDTTPNYTCPACAAKRRHTAEDWEHHPDRGSGASREH
jgi:hypothetical protein